MRRDGAGTRAGLLLSQHVPSWQSRPATRRHGSPLAATFLTEDHVAVSVATAVAVALASNTELEKGNAPAWSPGDEGTSQVPLYGAPAMTVGASSTSDQSCTPPSDETGVLAAGVAAIWWRIVDNPGPDAFPPEVWKPFSCDLAHRIRAGSAD